MSNQNILWPNTSIFVPSTKCQVPSAKYQVPSTKCQVPRARKVTLPKGKGESWQYRIGRPYEDRSEDLPAIVGRMTVTTDMSVNGICGACMMQWNYMKITGRFSSLVMEKVPIPTFPTREGGKMKGTFVLSCTESDWIELFTDSVKRFPKESVQN